MGLYSALGKKYGKNYDTKRLEHLNGLTLGNNIPICKFAISNELLMLEKEQYPGPNRAFITGSQVEGKQTQVLWKQKILSLQGMRQLATKY
jgi:hypothetical protein